MLKSEINKRIVAEARRRIAEAGLEHKLDLYPVTNVFTRRPRFWKSGDMCYFKVHMWDLNSLDEHDASAELDSRISAARTYFNI